MVDIYQELLDLCRGEGDLETIKFLVKNGVDIHANNDLVLGCASYYGQLKIVKYLIENEANIHSVNDRALRWASRKGHLETVKFLLEKGADRNVIQNESCLKYLNLLDRTKIRKVIIIQKHWKEWKRRKLNF